MVRSQLKQAITVCDAGGGNPRTVEIDDIGPRPVFGTPEDMRWSQRYFALITLALLDADDPELTTVAGAKLAGRVEETIRRWCVKGLLGRWDSADRQWKFRRSELISLLVRRHGRDRLPAVLRNHFVG